MITILNTGSDHGGEFYASPTKNDMFDSKKVSMSANLKNEISKDR